jgi:phosphatidylethanolamine-binding protein (PEBP) family uncharacterized protein
VAAVLTLGAAGCGSSSSGAGATSTTTVSVPTPSPSKSAPSKEPTFGKIALTSSAFKVGGAVPVRYTCDGANESPPLQWTGVPHGTVELLLLALDLTGEAKDGIQWAVAGISPATTQLAAGSLPAGAVQGANSAGKDAWAGLCGEKGHPQHVAFILYALRRKLGLKAGFDARKTRERVRTAKLASGLTLATYERH